ncbi:alpha/beta hydrolase [Altererythrobacter lutimaris]|uniref:Alpha/beta fold hydrolase n=1 Tax=Altererythrobacter lutimaris TaxID=2743979 RepID=A0A850H9J3_9SPHN|nr:alpha/beta fold hydrolase [Altererythrobacter lutimaris]NVE93546.1 alpha/beta fold hydrolase [Altererythrobacter lutimaris]
MRKTLMGVAMACLTALAMPAPASAEELSVTHEGLSGALKGTFLQSDVSNAPAVLIIPGSGPTDRDGNSPLGINAASYRLLAEGLGEAGISSLRVDKRGMFGSSAAIDNPNNVTFDAYIADTLAWAETLAERTDQDCAWLLGHSEGGVVALATVASSTDGICGVILAASPGRPVGDLLREQLRANPANAPLLGQAEAAISALEAGEDYDATNLHPALVPLFGAQTQGFLKSFMAYDPAALAAEYSGPLLILQPDEDIQVAMADGAAMHTAQPQSKLVVLEGVNHVLKSVPAGDRAANLQTYANPDLPLADMVVQTIARFIEAEG